MRSLRLLLLGVSFASLLAPRAEASEAVGPSRYGIGPGMVHPDSILPPPSSLPYVRYFSTFPARPLAGEPTVFVVAGGFPFRCGEVSPAALRDLNHIAITIRPRASCPDSVRPGATWYEGFLLGALPAGVHRIEIELTVMQDPAAPDGADRAVYRGVAAFSVAPRDTIAPPPPPPAPPDTLPYVDLIATRPERPTSAESTTIVLAGRFPWRCGEVFGLPGLARLGLRPSNTCSEITRSWKWRFPLGLLRAGHYRIEIAMTVFDDPAAPGTDSSVYREAFEFNVFADSVPPPPPIPPAGPLPYVDDIRIIPKPNLLPVERPICPNDSILVLLSGHFPSTCYSLKAIQLIRNPTAGFAVAPPDVRIIVDTTGCGRPPCAHTLVPWRQAVTFEPLPSQGYHLVVQLAAGSCLDSIFPEPQYQTLVPFEVARCSTTVEPCAIGTFDHPNGSGQCDAGVSPARPARVTFDVHTAVPLSGLQGELRLDPPGLLIARLAPTGPAAGMHLSWTPTRGGARFVMFAEHGAPIPASPWGSGTPPVPVLNVVVDQPAGTRAPAVTWVSAPELLGSDVNGRGIPMCQILDWERLDGRYFTARICAERECDFNGDGHVDVRDLVLMVHCLNHEGRCPDSTGAMFDCNRDSSFSLEDVICCGRRILGEDRCPDGPCPPDSTASRPEPGIALSLDSPRLGAGVVELTLHLKGADRVGAAKLVLDFPADRYEVTGLDSPESITAWLDLFDVRGNQVVIGLIRTRRLAAGIFDGDREQHDLTLHLALKPGQTPGGEVTATGGEFSGTDGVRLEVAMGRPTRRIGGPIDLALSVSRPNPFSDETRFSVTLDRSADVEVGVYDIGGRLVASLFRGRLDAGLEEFGWNGARVDGSAASNGIYFYRATAQNRTVSRRLLLLRGR